MQENVCRYMQALYHFPFRERKKPGRWEVSMVGTEAIASGFIRKREKGQPSRVTEGS